MTLSSSTESPVITLYRPLSAALDDGCAALSAVFVPVTLLQAPWRPGNPRSRLIRSAPRN